MVPRNTKCRLPSSSGSRMRRGSERGAWTTARPLLRPKPSSPSMTTAKLRLLLRIFGKGRAGSSANGLNTGSTSRSKYAANQAACASVHVSGATNTTPFLASSGRRPSLRSSYCSSTRRTVRVRIAFSCSGTDSPSGAPCTAPASSSCFRPATRISKNSSRFAHEMHRNFTRSSSGILTSFACSKTRWLNSRNDSSRLM